MACTYEFSDLRGRLMRARQAERFVPYAEPHEPGWSPAEQRCHENVAWWTSRHEGFTAVRGWLVFDFARASVGLIPVVRFTAHSVLQGPDETLTDITPTRAIGRYPFVLHPGDPEEFVELVEGLDIGYIDCHTSMS